MTLPADTRISRRRLLAGGAMFVALGSYGALWLALGPKHTPDWIEAVVRKSLPNARLDGDSLARFAARLARDPEFQSRSVQLAAELDSIAAPLVRLAPEVNRKLERLERLVVSRYLLSSNFFRVANPAEETIICGEPLLACGNPFARFRDA
jgi:hypothetical protein